MWRFLHCLRFKVKNLEISSKSLFFQLCDQFVCFLRQFGWISATVSLVFEVEKITFVFFLCFGVTFSSKGDFVLKEAKLRLVKENIILVHFWLLGNFGFEFC